MAKPGTLIIGRHGESEWNARGVWTGSTDVHLTELGHKQASQQGALLAATTVTQAFASNQVRSQETLRDMMAACNQLDVPTHNIGQLDERDYGDYTGKNKWEVKELIGDEAFQGLRRGWDVPVPGGETLADVYRRAVPFYCDTIVPLVNQGECVLIVAHGNSIRSLQKYIEDIADDAIGSVEMIFGTLLFYELDEAGRMTAKTVQSIDTQLLPA